MARITQAQRQANKEKYDEEVYQLFLDIGWENLTYERVANHLKVKKSTLQSYYPSRHDIYSVWRDRHIPKFRQLLKFDSQKSFLASWEQVLDDEILGSIIGYAISNVILKDDAQAKFPFNGIQALKSQLSPVMNEQECRETIQAAIGIAVLKLASKQVN